MTLNEHDKDYIEKRMHSKDQAQDNMIASIDRGLKEINLTFQKHSEEDGKNFGLIQNTLNDISIHMKNSNEFMENLKPLSDVFKGVGLLRKPSLWIVGFVVGAIVLFGGIKTISAWFIKIVTGS